ncbi:Hypothetical protein SMAX5B_013310 [Scophthalmus maximus]|uniref:Uncharacterized protein n=1 Tax=Scophthalmus maximus TaxID=52904 RepID=A0A2U9B5D7_SCOMX|nr:Hypothetical protein SMAX5B_013310 [Scophthalmus maximus]
MFDGREIILFSPIFSVESQILTHAAVRSDGGQFLEANTSVHIPDWTATTCSPSDFWEKLISCPGLREGSLLLLLQTSRVTGVNSPTRGRFTAKEQQPSISGLLPVTRQSRLGPNHFKKKFLIELKNEQTRQFLSVVKYTKAEFQDSRDIP